MFGIPIQALTVSRNADYRPASGIRRRYEHSARLVRDALESALDLSDVAPDLLCRNATAGWTKDKLSRLLPLNAAAYIEIRLSGRSDQNHAPS